ncbi:aminopeptidase P family N-terminal domain-containing protein [Ruegeria faecimaris]
MAKAGLDALFFEAPSNMTWLTGYEGWSFYVHQGILVFHDADPIRWERNQDTNGERRTVWMPDCQILPH